MRFPAQAIAWELWWRHRWGLSLALLYGVAVVLFLQLVPPEALARSIGEAVLAEALAQQSITVPELKLLLGNFLMLPLVAALLHQLVVFVYGIQANVSTKESNYPGRMFTLPVRTVMLVTWPMLYGAIAVALTTSAIVGGVQRPCGVELP